MSSVQCTNCNVSLSRMRRHTLRDESQALVNTIRLWNYPRDIIPTDHICHSCWQLAMHQVNDTAESVPRRQIGHQHVCVVCGRSITRISRRRVLIDTANEQEQRLAHIISTWIQPRELTSQDEACVPCWLRARRRVRSLAAVPDIHPPYSPAQSDQYQDVMCAVCGQSLASEELSVEQPRPGNIARLLELQQISAMNEVCGVCWEQAQATERPLETERSQEAESPQEIERPQYVTLPNMRRAAETPRHCIFQDCTGPERHSIPEETRHRVLIHFQYFIPQGARICTEHLREAHFENLYSAEYSVCYFTTAYIEEIIFILMERLKNINYENIQEYPENQVEYFIGITKQQHQQILDATPRLRNMHRGSFALTVLLCKLRTGDSGDRLSCLFQVPRRTLEILMSTARNILNSDYVPLFVGFNHLTREQMVTKSLYIAENIFGEPESPSDQKPMITIRACNIRSFFLSG